MLAFFITPSKNSRRRRRQQVTQLSLDVADVRSTSLALRGLENGDGVGEKRRATNRPSHVTSDMCYSINDASIPIQSPAAETFQELGWENFVPLLLPDIRIT